MTDCWVFCVAETWFCGSTSTTEQLSKLHHKMSAKLWVRAGATWFGDKEWIGPTLLCHKGCHQMKVFNPKTLTMSTTIRKIYLYCSITSQLKNAALITGICSLFFFSAKRWSGFMSAILIHVNSPNWVDLSSCQGDQNLTLYPEDLMCTPLFVSVDFILMKNDRSRVLSGAKRLGLLDSTEERNTRKKK